MKGKKPYGFVNFKLTLHYDSKMTRWLPVLNVPDFLSVCVVMLIYFTRKNDKYEENQTDTMRTLVTNGQQNYYLCM